MTKKKPPKMEVASSLSQEKAKELAKRSGILDTLARAIADKIKGKSGNEGN